MDEKTSEISHSNLKTNYEWNNAKNLDIWQDEQTMIVLNGG